MTRAVAAQLAIRYVPLALALGLLAWRFSIDWSYMTPREVRDEVQSSLLVALPWQFLRALPAESSAGSRVTLSASGNLLALVLAVGIGGIITYNDHVARQNLDCVATVRAVTPVATSESLAAEAACYGNRVAAMSPNPSIERAHVER